MRRSIIVCLIILITGCASPYKPHGLGGGYSETQLNDNVFRVSFRGNGYTSQERASDYSLLRAAELAKKNGFSYFIVVDNKSYVNQSTFTTPTNITTTSNVNTMGNANIYGNNINYNATGHGTATTHVSGGDTYVITRPTSTNTIVCFKEKPDINGLIYNADFIIKSLSNQYGVKIE